MQNFELDISKWVPRSYEAYFGGNMRNDDILMVHVTVENKYVEILGNFGGPFGGRKLIAKKCVSLEDYR